MKHPTRFILACAMLALAQIVHAQTPTLILGRSSSDKFLPGFWAQNSNASNLVAGLNANAVGSILFDDGLLPSLITSKSLSGTFNGTNTFLIRSWDDGASAWQSFDFNWSSGLPLSSNTVARVGVAEMLQNKTMVSTKFGTAEGAFFEGLLLANGSGAVSAVLGITTNIWVGGPNMITITDGAITDFTGNTNIAATGITSLNGLTEVTQIFATGTSGTDFNISSADDTHTINLPTASASARGALSAADWTTFNAKATATATLTALGGYNQNGLVTQVSENTFAGRTIVSGDNSIEVVNGDGVSGDIDVRVAMGSGYFYIPTVEGTPAGTPAAQTGKVPIVYDTTAHALWVYDGGWLKIQASAP